MVKNTQPPTVNIDPALLAAYQRQQAEQQRANDANAEIQEVLRKHNCTINVQIVLDSATPTRAAWYITALPLPTNPGK